MKLDFHGVVLVIKINHVDALSLLSQCGLVFTRLSYITNVLP